MRDRKAEAERRLERINRDKSIMKYYDAKNSINAIAQIKNMAPSSIHFIVHRELTKRKKGLDKFE